MTDFSHMKALDVSADKVREYTFHQITVNGRSPVLTVAPATEANKPYFNALLKRAGKTSRALRVGAVNSGMIEENREEDKELYPRTIVKGWHDVLDADGAEVKFSREECAQFLSALPNWVFDDFRNYCGDPANFADLLDIEVTAKN